MEVNGCGCIYECPVEDVWVLTTQFNANTISDLIHHMLLKGYILQIHKRDKLDTW